MAAFMPRPDIHGSLLGLIGFAADPVDEPETVAPPKPEPEYDDRSAFEPADSCTCFINGPCSYCLNLPEEN